VLMVTKETASKNQQYLWITVSIIALSIPALLFRSIDAMFGGKEGYGVVFGRGSGVVTILCLIGIVVTSVAIYKLKRWLKLVPIVCMILLLLLAVATYFNYWFSGYGQL